MDIRHIVDLGDGRLGEIEELGRRDTLGDGKLDRWEICGDDILAKM